MAVMWKRWAARIAIGVVAAVVLVTGGTWVYLNVLRDPPAERLSLDDDGSASTASTTATTDSTDGTAGPAATTGAGVDGTWKVITGSQAGDRVPEVLNGQSTEAVGRTGDVTGNLTIAGTKATDASFTVDMATVASDESRRDNQFRGRIMDVASHPTSTFELTAPIDFTSVPAAGQRVSATATGDLTLKGVTKSVTFPIEAERTDTGFRVAGSIPVHFADYGIDNPSAGPARVGDDGELEFLLVFAR
jgi:polyisoprenoid-binding protein YceI